MAALAARACGVAILLMTLPGMGEALAQQPPSQRELVARGAHRLSGAEILSTHVGRTVYHTNLTGGHVVPVFYPDKEKRLSIEVDGRNPHPEINMGRYWEVDGDARCDQARFRPGMLCWYIYRFQDRLYLCSQAADPAADDLPCQWTLRSVPGNPEKLEVGKR